MDRIYNKSFCSLTLWLKRHGGIEISSEQRGDYRQVLPRAFMIQIASTPGNHQNTFEAPTRMSIRGLDYYKQVQLAFNNPTFDALQLLVPQPPEAEHYEDVLVSTSRDLPKGSIVSPVTM
jgi:hypothetical protein